MAMGGRCVNNGWLKGNSVGCGLDRVEGWRGDKEVTEMEKIAERGGERAERDSGRGKEGEKGKEGREREGREGEGEEGRQVEGEEARGE